MCTGDDDFGKGLRLVRCPHGTYHLVLRNMTLHFSAKELKALLRVVSIASQQHPDELCSDAVPRSLAARFGHTPGAN